MHDKPRPRAALRAEGHALLFPAATLFGALAVPLWLAVHLGWLPATLPPVVHAHEMLMGYALAVVGGFLLTKPTRRALALAVAAWSVGRAAGLLNLPPLLALVSGLAYPAALFWLAGVPFLRAAKSGHNAVFGPLLGTFAVAELLYRLGAPEAGLALAWHLVALLLLTMGGRVIPAATAGELRRQGSQLVERVQRPLEALGVGGIVVAGLTATLGVVPWLGGAASVLAGISALARLARWRTRAVLRRPDLWSLHLGYAWLGVGLVAAGFGRIVPLADGAAAWHVVAVGGLGTLAASMMVRASLQRAGRSTDFPPAATAAIVLVGIAAATRMMAGWVAPVPSLVIATLCWAAAQLLILGVVLRIPARRRAAPSQPPAPS